MARRGLRAWSHTQRGNERRRERIPVKRTEWWRDFFHGLPVAFWHHRVPPSLTAAEASFLDAQFLAGARLLDVPCGDGRLSHALAPGAVFVLDASTAESVFPVYQPQRRVEVGGFVMESTVTWDPLPGELRSDYVFTRGAEVQHCTAWLRLRPACETAGLLRAAGFASVEVSGGLDSRPLGLLPGQRSLFVARALVV